MRKLNDTKNLLNRSFVTCNKLNFDSESLFKLPHTSTISIKSSVKNISFVDAAPDSNLIEGFQKLRTKLLL